MRNECVRLSFGPLKVRRIVLSIWIPLLICLGADRSATCVLAAIAGLVLLPRSMAAGVSIKGESLIVRNLFRTWKVPTRNVQSISFRSRLLSLVGRMELTLPGKVLAVSGVSLWVGGLRLPWQRPDRRIVEIDHFVEQAGLLGKFMSPRGSDRGHGMAM